MPHLSTVKRYTPSLETVWQEWHREQRVRKLRAKREADAQERAAKGLPPRQRIPDNSTPWLDHEPRSLAELIFISDKIREHNEQWMEAFKPSSKI